MSRRARARAGAINAKRIAFAPDLDLRVDSEDAHDDSEAWAWAETVSRECSARATVKSGPDTTTGASAQTT